MWTTCTDSPAFGIAPSWLRGGPLGLRMRGSLGQCSIIANAFTGRAGAEKHWDAFLIPPIFYPTSFRTNITRQCRSTNSSHPSIGSRRHHGESEADALCRHRQPVWVYGVLHAPGKSYWGKPMAEARNLLPSVCCGSIPALRLYRAFI
jgi:hypothetical protein